MGLGLGISVDWASLVPYYAKVASAFAARVKADGGTVENTACLKKDLKALNPIEPTGYLLIDYPGAAAAYSLRLINKTYAGSTIRVRRATDNAEQNIGFASKQLDTETLESFVNSGEAFTDPDITSSYNWTKGANTTYNAATEALDLLNENGLTARQGVSVSGHTYTITIVLDSVTFGGVKVYAGGTQSAVISTAGTHTLEITANNSNNILGINPSGAATCSISRFSAIDTTADAFVTTWYDQSGNNKNVSRANASEQPQIVENGSTITQNGSLTIRFGQFGILNLSPFNSVNNQMATTGIYVAKGTASSSNGPLSLVGNIGQADDFGMTTEIAIRTGGGYRLWGNTTAATQLSLVSMFKPSGANIADVECSLNGSILTASGITDNIIDYGSNTNLFIGSKTSSKFNGVISEVILYPTDELSNRTGIETNINDFYSIY